MAERLKARTIGVWGRGLESRLEYGRFLIILPRPS